MFYTISKYNEKNDGEPDLDIGGEFNTPKDLINYAQAENIYPLYQYHVTKYDSDCKAIDNWELAEFIIKVERNWII